MLASYFMAIVGSIHGPPVTDYFKKPSNFSVLSSFQPSSIVAKVRIGVTGGIFFKKLGQNDYAWLIAKCSKIHL